MNSRLKLRLEAARIAAQVEGVTTRNFTATARRVERYILAGTRSPEHVTMEDVTRETVRRTLDELTDANEAIRHLTGLERDFHDKYMECFLPQDCTGNTAVKETAQPCTLPEGLSIRRHDPSFVSDLIRTFASYPAAHEDFNRAARHRQELYHDLGLEPEPFNGRQPHPRCDTSQGTVYLAPGGMPSSEAESIYLQDSGDKLE